MRVKDGTRCRWEIQAKCKQQAKRQTHNSKDRDGRAWRESCMVRVK
jgi:hypothetical protein